MQEAGAGNKGAKRRDRLWFRRIFPNGGAAVPVWLYLETLEVAEGGKASLENVLLAAAEKFPSFVHPGPADGLSNADLNPAAGEGDGGEPLEGRRRQGPPAPGVLCHMA